MDPGSRFACPGRRAESGRGQGRGPPKAGARLAPALRPADHRSTSAQLHDMAFRCVDMQDNIKRLSVPENSMAKSHLRVIAAAAVGIASLLPPQASSAEMTNPGEPFQHAPAWKRSTRATSPTMSRWSRSPAAGSGSLTPVRSGAAKVTRTSRTPPILYAYRPPIDLANPKLRKLAAALGHAYSAGQRNVGEQHLLRRNRPRAIAAAGLQGRAEPATMEGRRRFRGGGRRADRHVDGDQPRRPRRLRRVDGRAGQPSDRLHAVYRRPHRGGRIHERADDRRHGRRAERL